MAEERRGGYPGSGRAGDMGPPAPVPSGAERSDASVAQDDLAAILRELGLGDHARARSPHQVVQAEVLPTIRAWRMVLEALRAAGVRTTAEHEAAHAAMEERFRPGSAHYGTVAGAPGGDEPPADECADIPDAPVPARYVPAPGERWRVGRRNNRAIWRVTPDNPIGEFIGTLDTPELVALVVEAVNRWLAGQHRQRWEDRLRVEDWAVAAGPVKEVPDA